MKLWTIPTTGIPHYMKNSEDRAWLRLLKDRFISSEYKIENCVEGIRFPGLYGNNDEYKEFYHQCFSDEKVFCAPRGNINKHGIVVMGINPGDHKYSEILHEPMWLFGRSSGTLHKMLEAVNIYPYFTDIIKEPFRDSYGEFKNTRPYSAEKTIDYLRPHLEVLKQEIKLLSPQLVICLGVTDQAKTEFYLVKESFIGEDGVKPEFINIHHPAAHGLSDETRVKELKQELGNVQIDYSHKQSIVSVNENHRHLYPFCDVHIHWKEVNLIEPEQGHGINLFYRQDKKERGVLVAFVKDFLWEHGVSNSVEVEILSAKSGEFDKCDYKVNKKAVMNEATRVLIPFLYTRKSPGDQEEIGNNLYVGLSG